MRSGLPWAVHAGANDPGTFSDAPAYATPPVIPLAELRGPFQCAFQVAESHQRQ